MVPYTILYHSTWYGTEEYHTTPHHRAEVPVPGQVLTLNKVFTILDKLEMLVLSTAGGTQNRSHINNTFLLVIYVFSML